MQVRSAGRAAGVTSSATPDVFQGLGDLPGLGHVRVEVACDDAIPLTEGLRLPAWHWGAFPDVRESKWLRDPPSALLQPLAPDIDLARRLSERTVSAAGAKRKRDAHEGVGELADPRDGLALAGPGRHHLGDVAAAIARAVLRLPGFCDAQALGADLARQLGGPAMTPADTDTVLRAVLRCAPQPPAFVAGKHRPPVQADRAFKSGVEALGSLLRGLGFGMAADPGHAPQRYVAALTHQALQLAVDPFYDKPQPAPPSSGFRQASGPLQVAAATFKLGSTVAPLMASFVQELMARLRSHVQVWHGPQAHRVAEHLAQFLASLGWLVTRARAGRADQIPAFITGMLGRSSSADLDASQLGAGLARAACPTKDDPDFQVAFLEALATMPKARAVRDGDLAFGFLERSGTIDPLGAVLHLAPRLKPLNLGNLIFSMALAAGMKQRWSPDGKRTREMDWLARCLDASASLDAQRQRTLWLGLVHAMDRLGPVKPGFKELLAGLDHQAAASPVGAGQVRHRAAARARHIVQDPRVAFGSGGADGPDAAQAVELTLLDMMLRSHRPTGMVRDCIDFVLGSTAPIRDRHRLLVAVLRSTLPDLLPRQLAPVRDLLIAGLQDRFAGQPNAQAVLASDIVRCTFDALRAIYRAQAPTWSDGGATARREREALESPSLALPPQARFALVSVLPRVEPVPAKDGQ